MTELVDLSGEEQRRLRATGQLSARDLVEASIARSEALNPHLTAWVATRFDEALEEASHMDETGSAGALWGLPVAIKDLNDVAAALEAKFGEAENTAPSWRPQVTQEISDDKAETMMKLVDALDDLDDVQNVYTNFEMSDEAMERLAG